MACVCCLFINVKGLRCAGCSVSFMTFVFGVCFVCGVLCCCLVFHWFVVRGYAVVVVLFSVLLFCYGLNDFPVCECICVCPVFALFFSFCVMLCVCLCVYVTVCVCCLFIEFIGLFCVSCYVIFLSNSFLVCVRCLRCVVLLFVVSMVCRACMSC